jgi:hypothetical protein
MVNELTGGRGGNRQTEHYRRETDRRSREDFDSSTPPALPRNPIHFGALALVYDRLA